MLVFRLKTKQDTIYLHYTMTKTSKTFRLPDDVVAAAEERAAELGLTLTDLLADVLAKEFKMPRQPSTALSAEVSSLIASTFDPKHFPMDVTLEVFHRIRDDADLRRLYDQAISDDAGQPDRHRRWSVHRRIGRIVKRRLGAKVIGRSLPLDPSVDLIESHALLQPT
jgi:hypothetical protein